MSASEHLQWALAVLMLAVAAYHAARLVHRARGRNSGRIDVELTHFAMGIAMAAMLVATLPPLAGRFLAGAFLLVLGWFLANAIHSFIWAGAAAAASPAQQVPICAGMVYMLFAPFVTGPPMPGMAHAGGAPPLLAPVLAVAVALPALAALPALPAPWRPMRQCTTRTTLGLCCQLAMSGTAVVMLAAS